MSTESCRENQARGPRILKALVVSELLQTVLQDIARLRSVDGDGVCYGGLGEQ